MRRAKIHPGESPDALGSKDHATLKSYKTSLCNKFMQQGVCDRGERCCFAHGISDLRQRVRPPNFKTQPCRNMAQDGTCPYGNKCDFIHSVELHSSSTSSRSVDSTDNNAARLQANDVDCRQQIENLLCAFGPSHLLQALSNVDAQALLRLPLPLHLQLPSSPDDVPSPHIPLAPARHMRQNQMSETYAEPIPQTPPIIMPGHHRAGLEPSLAHPYAWEASRNDDIQQASACVPAYSLFGNDSFGQHASAFSPFSAPQQHHSVVPSSLLASPSTYRHPDRFPLPHDPRFASQNATRTQDTLTERLATLDLTRFNKFY